MRETIKEWKDEWIETNGITNELEVLITDVGLHEMAPYVYEGCFANIPKELENRCVISSGQIIESSLKDHIGAYSLTI